MVYLTYLSFYNTVFQAVKDYDVLPRSSYTDYNNQIQKLNKDLIKANSVILNLLKKMEPLSDYEVGKSNPIAQSQENEAGKDINRVNYETKHSYDIFVNSSRSSNKELDRKSYEFPAQMLNFKRREKVLVELIYYMVANFDKIPVLPIYVY